MYEKKKKNSQSFWQDKTSLWNVCVQEASL